MKKNKNIDEYTCYMCGDVYNRNKFYTTYNPLITLGLIPYCKICLASNCLDNNENFIVDKFKNMLRLIDKPFLNELWDSTIETVSKNQNNNYFGIYMKNIQMPQYREHTWLNSSSHTKKQNIDKTAPVIIDNARVISTTVSEELINKWGMGYQDVEYISFEKKYQFLKHHYAEKTAMHTEALLNYIRYRVKEEIATAEGNIKASKEWGTLAKNAGFDAKINPSQLTSNDLSDGLNSVGQIVRAVEQNVDIIKILPIFKKNPQDSVDFTILCYINYIRDMFGEEPAEYEEVFKFYNDRIEEYKSHGKPNFEILGDE